MMRRFLTVAVIFIAAILFSLFYVFALPEVRKFRPHLTSSWYDWGLYGAYPVQSHWSSEVQSPRVEILQGGLRCQEGLTLLTPRGVSVAAPGPMILDARGNLVWAEQRWGQATDLRVQTYKGEKYLTYWSGKSEKRSHGKGSYYMLDSSYRLVRTVNAVGGHLNGDFHEFQITENGTALMTIYDAIPMNLLSVGGPMDGWIYDGVFQEIDITTGDLLFEWRASQHYSMDQSFFPVTNTGSTKDNAFDFFHINSVDKDAQGNYYVSGRATHTVTCVSPHGAVLWTLGGRSNNFVDLSEGAATNFAWQHDARWHPDHTLTLFDNAAYDNIHQSLDHSRGLVIALDTHHMTATLRRSYSKPSQFRSESQGSMQLLAETGNVLLGWGNAAAYTEFSAEGEILCDVHFGASSVWAFGRAGSYRVSKAEWYGTPTTSPDIVMVDCTIYVSWNGATEIAAWELQSGKSLDDAGEGTFEAVDHVSKEGFESTFLLPEDMGPYLRVAALDTTGRVLGYSDVLDTQTGQSTTHPKKVDEQQQHLSSPIWLFVAICAAISAAVSVKLFWAPISNSIPFGRRRHRYSRLSLVSRA